MRRRPAFSFGRWLEREGVFGWLMVALPVAFLVALVGYPFFYGIWISLQDRPVAKPGVFIGLGNFIAAWHDPVFWQVVINTFVYTFAATLLKMVGGLGLALVMNQDFRFKNLTRALLLLPFIVPTVLSTIAWQWILDPAFSVINWALMRDRPGRSRPELARQPAPRDVLADHGQHLARPAVLRHHPAGRPADHLARALRGGDHRRRRRAGAASATSPCRC